MLLEYSNTAFLKNIKWSLGNVQLKTVNWESAAVLEMLDTRDITIWLLSSSLNCLVNKTKVLRTFLKCSYGKVIFVQFSKRFYFT